MAAKIKSDTKELDGIIENFKKFTSFTVPVLVRKHARLLAVELSNRTQPFSVGGTSKNASQLGKNAVSNDLSKVFRTKESLQKVIDRTGEKEVKARLQEALNSGNNKLIGSIFKEVGMISDFQMVSKSQLPDKHKSQRSKKSGRTWTNTKEMNIATSSAFSGYVSKIQRRVGYSKAAWADCARKIGGIKGDGARGIPAFAKSKNHGSNGSIIDKTSTRRLFFNASKSYIKMTSNIPWASRILRQSEIQAAQHIVRDKMIKESNKMTKAAAKQNFNPTPEDNE